MQAIILAAGKGSRLEPLSCAKDKPLLKIMGKTILERNLDELKGLIKEAILIIRPNDRGRAVISLFGAEYNKIKIKYVVQKQPLGTGHAAKSALEFIEDKFLLLNGDDLYSREDINAVLKKFPCILVKEVEDPRAFGVIESTDGVVENFVEKPKRPKSNLANIGLYFLPKSIFDYKIQKSSRGEYEITDYIRHFIKENKLYFKKAKTWLPISYCWNVLEANRLFLAGIKKEIQGKVEKDVVIKGEAKIGKGSIIKTGTYIEGPVIIGKNCIIGPNSYIRAFTSIGDSCRIGQAVEIKESIIGDNTNIAHLSFVGDSIIGDNCNLAAGTIIANLRHDGQTVHTEVNGVLKDTGRKKLGAIIGDNVKTGIGTLIYPGRKIWPDKTIEPGAIIKKDVK
ncbi:NTP transferase domain-containing protein [Patescibacteria group bacterium]|nr:NTP transferase domain-containing protein [Patescibacteria group bacterium]MBU4078238.1 NTP transferase domain-containing protein [Patescibacteria group bacterium]